MASLDPQSASKLIVALDYEDPNQAYRLVETLGDQVRNYKVGPMLFTQSGGEAIVYLKKHGKTCLVDLKLHDTPGVVANTVKQLAEMGADYVTVHLMGGSEMLRAATRSCRGTKLRVLGLTLLTSQVADELKNWGWSLSEEEIVVKLVDVALEARLAGILCSPHELEKVTSRVLPGFELFTPGIRVPALDVFEDDQKRVASPNEAFKWGADYVIVGRPITQSPHPLEAVEQLLSWKP